MTRNDLYERRGVISDGVEYILKRDIEPALLEQYYRRRERYPEFGYVALRNLVYRTSAPIRGIGITDDSAIQARNADIERWRRLYKSQQA